jgi:hypothetical protein
MNEKQRQNQIMWGVLLILAGIWLGLSAMGYAWARMERLWPLLGMGVGAVSLISGLRGRRDEDAVWFGVVVLLASGFFLHITVGPGEWGDLRHLWPVFVLIGAVGWLVSWIINVRKVSNLVLAGVAFIVGILGLAFTFERIDPELGQRLLSFWPVILIVIGIGLLIQFLVQRE